MVSVLIIKVRMFWMQMGYKDRPLLFSRMMIVFVIDALDEFKQRTLILHWRE